MGPKTCALILANIFVVLNLLYGATAESRDRAKPSVGEISSTGKTLGFTSSLPESLSAQDPLKQYSITMKKYLRQTGDVSFTGSQKKPIQPKKKGLPIVSKDKPSGYGSRSEENLSKYGRIKRSDDQDEGNLVSTTKPAEAWELEDKDEGDKGEKGVAERCWFFKKKEPKKEKKKEEEKKNQQDKKNMSQNGTKDKANKPTSRPTLKPETITSEKPTQTVDEKTLSVAPPESVKTTTSPKPESPKINVINLPATTTTTTTTTQTPEKLSTTRDPGDSAIQITLPSKPRAFDCGKVLRFNRKSVRLNSTVEKVGPAIAVHGIDAIRGEWPWVAQIHICPTSNPSSCTICTGTLLNQEWLITSGHCVAGFQDSSYTFSATFDELEAPLDGSKRGPPWSYRKIISTLLHPEYDDMNSDLALLKLEQQVEVGETIQPVCLLPATRNLLQYTRDKECYILGYGLKKSRQAEGGSRRLQALKIRPEEPSKCNSDTLLETTMKIGTLCVSTPGNHTGSGCMTDSGGANLCYDESLNKWQLFAVTSYGAAQCDPQQCCWLSVDLSNYRSWIRSSIS